MTDFNASCHVALKAYFHLRHCLIDVGCTYETRTYLQNGCPPVPVLPHPGGD